MNNIPLIFDIQRTSFVDGQGIRTVVFFKGCPLECEWCHNPESQSPEKEILWYNDLCKNCRTCSDKCKNNAIRNDYEYKVNKTKCKVCGECVKACDYKALKMAGKEYEVESLVNVILKDKLYFDVSGGGVTFSGGEPLMFMEFLSDVCKELKEKDIDITLQTCGYFNFGEFEKHISPYINTIYFDLKIADDKLHLEYTNKSNKLILENLNKLFFPKKHKVIIRTPLIEGITNTSVNLNRIKEIINKYDYDDYEELLFNDSFIKKLENLGREK
ncbi:MAG: glycyl-radical enzyme activating protein [Bacteroidales bacterium]|nr:glycyl-radical enzyme activating protein [Bacteroidales bacterium]